MSWLTLENSNETMALIWRFVNLQALSIIDFVFICLGTFIFGCIMSLAALAQEKFWENKAQCEDAEKAYYSRLSGAKVSFFCFFYLFSNLSEFWFVCFFTYYPLF